jgi:hypothetical protein
LVEPEAEIVVKRGNVEHFIFSELNLGKKPKKALAQYIDGENNTEKYLTDE